ncbi:hypothetical protein K5D34_21165 [Pseudomonas cichorii]|uniref:Peptidase inhibitor I78 family protein n=1 Tax=Pseudomonas lijiangensis TaxID=2995658 RepID=A0ABX8HWV0_9PSED|nr:MULTISPECIES: I78 family peptidase inhibitor [Pseudomonas syringae group]MBI6853154.1 hypothetical protein [Pseudomonas cichorii]MBX8502114.1 hypothetical protein [Pseudomonas lijiangensis]MBX8507015.1 hypothetical protein [Pseudomonas lijiangensis]MBX8512196.1 hypothetical protein [Pseudomonas cichorii]MBX8527177.1 hypothetical protein [Pseudomonas cichorii]
MEKIIPSTVVSSFAAAMFCVLLSLPGEHSFASEQSLDHGHGTSQPPKGKMTVYGCYAARASSMLGEEFTTENRMAIEKLARARGSRVVSSGGPRDLSYSPLRLNIEVNGQNRIEDISCG